MTDTSILARVIAWLKSHLGDAANAVAWWYLTLPVGRPA